MIPVAVPEADGNLISCIGEYGADPLPPGTPVTMKIAVRTKAEAVQLVLVSQPVPTR